MRRISDAEPWWRRLLGVLALLLLVLLVLGAWALGIGLGDGYGGAQSWRAARLAELADDRLRTLRRLALRDLALYIPAYLVVGAVVAVLVVRAARRQAIVLALLVAGALADLVETLLFRRSLTRLLAGAAPELVDRTTKITAVFTGVKWVALVAALALVVLFATLGERAASDGR